MDNLYNLCNEIIEFQKKNETIWLYEKRAWWETVFLFNIYPSDLIELPKLKWYNQPSLWRARS